MTALLRWTRSRCPRPRSLRDCQRHGRWSCRARGCFWQCSLDLECNIVFLPQYMKIRHPNLTNVLSITNFCSNCDWVSSLFLHCRPQCVDCNRICCSPQWLSRCHHLLRSARPHIPAPTTDMRSPQNCSVSNNLCELMQVHKMQQNNCSRPLKSLYNYLEIVSSIF